MLGKVSSPLHPREHVSSTSRSHLFLALQSLLIVQGSLSCLLRHSQLSSVWPQSSISTPHSQQVILQQNLQQFPKQNGSESISTLGVLCFSKGNLSCKIQGMKTLNGQIAVPLTPHCLQAQQGYQALRILKVSIPFHLCWL